METIKIKDLSGADLSGANLSEADLWRANLSEADLSGANLSWANLSEADLSGANLSEADLSGASLWRANLSEADLSGANLWRANLSEADLPKELILLPILDVRNYRPYIWEDRIFSGCKSYSLQEALEHWGSEAYPVRERGKHYCKVITDYTIYKSIQAFARSLA